MEDNLEEDNEERVLQNMESFYNKNYITSQAYQSDNFTNERVWNVFYDTLHDQVYVFMARITVEDALVHTEFKQEAQ